MAPVSPAEAAVRLTDSPLDAAWNWMMEAPTAAAPSPAVDGGRRLARVVALVEEALLSASSRDRVRRAPSAGAIHPYDLVALTDAGAFQLDLVRRSCTRLPVPEPAIARMLARSPARDGAPADAALLLLTRPWLSMRKYGSRGYFYAQLDAGHVAAALAGSAAGSADAVLRLRIPRLALAETMRPHLPYREPHSLLALRFPDGRAPAPVRWPVAGATGPAPHGDLERYCWASIPLELLGADLPPGRGLEAPLFPVERDAAAAISRSEWRTLTAERTSCKQFTGEVPEDAAIRAALGALATPLPTDLDEVAAPDDPAGVRITVLRATPERREETVAACMGQEHAGRAGAFVLFHADRASLLADKGTQQLKEALLRAAAGAHLGYLGAARTGMGVTAIGGYHGDRWRRIAGLGEDRELLYLLAFGIEGDAALKLDRLETAHAHGE